MAQTDYANDPGLVWSPSLRPPKHPATVERGPDGLYFWACSRCGERGTAEVFRSAAMTGSMNHRAEYK